MSNPPPTRPSPAFPATLSSNGGAAAAGHTNTHDHPNTTPRSLNLKVDPQRVSGNADTHQGMAATAAGAGDISLSPSRPSTRGLGPVGGSIANPAEPTPNKQAPHHLETMQQRSSSPPSRLPATTSTTVFNSSPLGKAPLPSRPLPHNARQIGRGGTAAAAGQSEREGAHGRRRGSGPSMLQDSDTKRRVSLDSTSTADAKAEGREHGGRRRRASTIESKTLAGTETTCSMSEASGSPREDAVMEAEVRREVREQEAKPDLDVALEKQREASRRRASLAVSLDPEALARKDRIFRLVVEAVNELGVSRLEKAIGERSGWAASIVADRCDQRGDGASKGVSALHLACWMDRAAAVRVLMSQWRKEVEVWYDRRVKALQARLRATSSVYDGPVVDAIRAWVEDEIARLARVRELRCEQIWRQMMTSPDKDGRTPLHYACARGSHRAAQELLRTGMGDFKAEAPEELHHHHHSHHGKSHDKESTRRRRALFPRGRRFHAESGSFLCGRDEKKKEVKEAKEEQEGRGGTAKLIPLYWLWKRMDLCARTSLAQNKGGGRTITSSLLSFFEEYDPKGTGSVTVQDFHRALLELGLDVSDETENCLCKLFEYSGGRRKQAAVDYEKLVRTMHSEEGPPSEAPKAPAVLVHDDAKAAAEPKDGGEDSKEAAAQKGGGGQGKDAEEEVAAKGVPRSQRDESTSAAVSLAAEVKHQPHQHQQHGETVEDLLRGRRRIVLDAADAEGRTPLHIAVVHSHIDLVRLLLENGATQELRSQHGETALSLAWSPVIHKALTAALVNKLGETGSSGFEGGAGSRRPSSAASAVAAMSNPSKTSRHQQVEACMKVLVDSGFRLSEPLGRIDCRAALHVAAITGTLRVALSLLEQDVDVNSRDANGWSALHYCAFLGSPEHHQLAKTLLEAGADVDALSKSLRSPLHLACINKRQGGGGSRPSGGGSKAMFVTLLASYGADVGLKDNKGYTPLHHACEAGDLRSLAALTDVGASLYARTTTGANAAHLAVSCRQQAVLRFLSEVDAEERRLLGQRDGSGRLPLELCVDEDVRAATRNVWEASGRLSVEDVKAILLGGAVRGAKGHEGWAAAGLDAKTARSGYTALHMAVRGTAERIALAGCSKSSKADKEQAERDGKRLVAFLLDHDAFVDSLDKLCRTPLMLACAAGLGTIAKLFLSKGADYTATDLDGNTPLHYAYAYSRLSLGPVLEGVGADILAVNMRGQTPEEALGVGQAGIRLLTAKKARSSTKHKDAKPTY